MQKSTAHSKPVSKTFAAESKSALPQFNLAEEEKMAEQTLSLMPTLLGHYQALKKETEAMLKKNKSTLSETESKKFQETLKAKLQKCKELKKDLEEMPTRLAFLAMQFFKENQFQKSVKHFQLALSLCQALSNSPTEAMARILTDMGTAFSGLGELPQCLECYQQAMDIYQHVHATEDKIAEVLNNRAIVFKRQGKYPEACADALQALAIKKRCFGEKDPRLESTLSTLGSILSDTQENIDEARRYYEEAAALVKVSHGEDSMEMAELLHNIGGTYALQSQYAEAKSYFKRALKIKKKLEGEEGASLISTWSCIGRIFAKQGKLNEAFFYYQKALVISKKFFGEESWQVAEDLSPMGDLLSEQGRYEEALAYHDRALKIRIRVLGEKSHKVAETYDSQANVALRQGAYDVAFEKCQQALIIQTGIYGEMGVVTAATANTLGNIYEMQGDWVKAQEVYVKVLAIYEKVKGAKASTIQMNLANVYTRQGDFQNAFLYYEKALASERAASGEESVGVALTHHNIAYALKQQGRFEEATSHFEKSLSLYQRLQRMDHFATCETRYLLARTYVAWGDELESAKAQPHYERAVAHYESLLKINHAVLSECKESNMYDLASHNTLLGALSDVYVKQGRLIVAGDLYEKEAERYRTLFPLLSLHYTTQAIKYFVNLETCRVKLANCYARVAEIAHARQRHFFAMKYLQQAVVLDPQASQEKKLKDWEAEQRRQVEVLGEDVHVKFSLMRDTFDEIQLLILEELEVSQPLSENIRNRITGLAVACQSLLDMGFGRFVEAVAPSSKDARKRQSFYFPVASSHQQLMQLLKDKQLDVRDKKYSAVYEALEEAQPYYYYDVKRNEKTPGLWKCAWVEKILAMSNGGKHIGLTPHRLSKDVTERQGFLAVHQWQMMVSYMESRFYPWMFVEGIKNISAVSDDKAITLSDRVLSVLREKHYVVDDSVVHPLARHYFDATQKTPTPEKLVEIQNQFVKQIETDFPRELKVYAPFVAQTLLRRSLQMSHHLLCVEEGLEFHEFFERAFRGIYHLLRAFGKACIKNNVSQDSHLSEIKEEKVIPKEGDRMSDPVAPPKTSASPEWVKYDIWVRSVAQREVSQGAHDSAGQHYDTAAKAIMNLQPSLAFHYYYKAFYHYGLCGWAQKALQEAYLECCEQYARRGLLQTAMSYLQRGVRKLNASYAAPLVARHLEYRTQLLETFATFDADVYSQLAHAKQQVLKLAYLHLKCKVDPNTRRRELKLQQELGDIVIKLRHALDQSFTVFVSGRIYLPNQKSAAISARTAIKFYAFSSEKKMKEKLKALGILNEDKTKKSLDRDFPEVFRLLMSVQPFSGDGEGNQWLRKMIDVSNQAKHRGIVFSSAEECAALLQLLNTAIPEIERILQEMSRRATPVSTVSQTSTLYSGLFFSPAGVGEEASEEEKLCDGSFKSAAKVEP